MEGDFECYKEVIDMFLSSVPDQPCIYGYHMTNLDKNGMMSNSIIDWSRNMHLDKWIPDPSPDSGKTVVC